MLKPSFFKILKTSSITHRHVYQVRQFKAVSMFSIFIVVNNLQHIGFSTSVFISLASMILSVMFCGAVLELKSFLFIVTSEKRTSKIASLFYILSFISLQFYCISSFGWLVCDIIKKLCLV